MIRHRKGQPIPEGWELVRMRTMAEVESDMEELRKKISSSSSSSLSPVDRSEAPTVRIRIEKNGTGVKLQEREERAVELNLRAEEEKDKKAEAEIATDENDIQFDIQEEESNSNPGENMEKETETAAVQSPKLEEKSASNSIARPAEDSEAKLKKTEKRKQPGLPDPWWLLSILAVFAGLAGVALFLEYTDIGQDVVLYDGTNHTGQWSFTEWTVWDTRHKKCVNLYGFNDRASSIDSRGRCLRIFEHMDCTGRMAVICPGTPSHWDLHHYNLDNAVSSIQPCGFTSGNGEKG